MEEPKTDRWSLLADTIIFQVKLGMDALRDLLLSPVSIICALIDIVLKNSREQSLFYQLMKLGHKSDHWINLFGSHSKKSSLTVENGEANQNQEVKNNNIDQLFSQVEVLLKEQHDKGGLTASAKASIDRYLDKIVTKQSENNSEV